MSEPTGTRPFAPFEWMLSLRYLRARRKEGFISVIAGFSFLGIMLGVATLIIVMAVMNGFRKELLDKILGLNGHLLVQPLESPLTDWKAVAERIAKVHGRPLAAPIVEGQALASSPFNATGVLVRGIRGDDLDQASPRSRNNIKQGTLEGFDEGRASRSGGGSPTSSSLRAGDNVTLVAPRKGAVDADGHDAAHQDLQGRRGVRDRHVGIRRRLRVHAAHRGAGLFQPRRRRHRDRGLHRQSGPDRRVPQARAPKARERPIFMIDWRQRNATFFNALQVERNVMFLILTLIVLVAALNIMSGLIMLVKDKGRDIAILRTMGATQGAIMRMFLITGASIGVVGTLRRLPARHRGLPEHRDRSGSSCPG